MKHAGAGSVGETAEQRIDKLWRDTYEGSGRENPSITLRLDRLERCMDGVEANTKATRDAVRNGLLSIIVMLAAAFISFRMGWVR